MNKKETKALDKYPPIKTPKRVFEVEVVSHGSPKTVKDFF